MLITLEQLKLATGSADEKLLKGINDTLTKFQINTPLRICHFLAQAMHESGNFKVTKENLNYSAKGLNTTFKKYFLTEAAALPYERNQQKIANKVYSNRMGNGDEASGDGWKYRGRGFLQCTGKNNYKRLSEDTGVDFINKPELLETLEYAALSAGHYWHVNKINLLADNPNTKEAILKITKAINGGLNGLEDRTVKFNKLIKIIK
jgi:putative chitinase